MHYGYRPALDGVRTLAVYLVLLFHTGMASMAGGFIGVDVFFVLSGFLVTQVLLAEADASGTIDVGRFYARRVRRLLPAALVVVVATCLVWTLVLSVVRRLPLVGDAQSALLYVANWRFLGTQHDYFATDVDQSPFLHFWSLAVEEQFYLLYPALLVVVLRVASRRRLALPLALTACLTACLAASLAAQVFWQVHDSQHAYLGTDARLYQLFAGALAAAVLRSGRRSSCWRGVGGWIGFLGVTVLGTGLVDLTASWRGMAVTLAAVLLVNAVTTWDRHPLTRLFSLGPAVYLGRISYGTYLWHWPVLLFLQEVLEVGPGWLAVMGAVTSTGLAAISYELVEMPVRRARRLRALTGPVVLTGLTVSALLAVLVVPQVLSSARIPAVASPAVPSFLAAATTAPADEASTDLRDVDWERWAQDRGEPHDCATADQCLVVSGSGPHVVLVGDSHAMFLSRALEALARDHDFTLSANTQVGCPWQADVANQRLSDAQRTACDEARATWYREVLPTLDADVVVLVANAYDNYDPGVVHRFSAPGEESTAELLLATTGETLDLVEQTGADALVLLSTLRVPGFEPLDCLARSTDQRACSVPVPLVRPASDAYYRAADVASSSVATVDLNPVICPDAPVCRPVLDGVPVWRDAGHLSASVLVRLRDGIWQTILDSGVMEGHAVS